MTSGLGKGPEHEAVPVGEDFFVPSGSDAVFSSAIKLFLRRLDFGLEFLNRYSLQLAEQLKITRDVQNVLLFEVSLFGHAEVFCDELRFSAGDF